MDSRIKRQLIWIWVCLTFTLTLTFVYKYQEHRMIGAQTDLIIAQTEVLKIHYDILKKHQTLMMKEVMSWNNDAEDYLIKTRLAPIPEEGD